MDTPIINHNDLIEFINNVLNHESVDPDEAQIVSKIMVWTDLIGRYTHGTMRLPINLNRLRHKLIQTPSNPVIRKKSETVYNIDGNNGFGQYLAHLGMSKSIEVAKTHGVGIVGVFNSNHFGASAYYVQMAAEQNLIGIALTNSFPKVAAHGGLSGVLGTNPIAFGAPTENGQSILVDFSTSIRSGASIREAKKHNIDLSEGIIVNQEGKSVVTPTNFSDGTLLPFGGAKGFCLGLIVEILSGVITGSSISKEITSIFAVDKGFNNVGHFFMALDIERFLTIEDYFVRLNKLTEIIKSSIRKDPEIEILLPGETRWAEYNRQLKEGIKFDSQTILALENLASKTNIPKPW